MMKNKQQNIDEVLLLRVIENRTDEGEKVRFKEWYDNSAENAAYFDQLKKTYERSSFDSYSADANWNQVVDKVRSGYTVPDYIELPETGLTGKNVGWSILLRVAAVIVLAAGIGFLINNIVFNPEQLIVSGNEMKNNEPYQMADGSLVYLHGNSEIQFHRNFGKNSRELVLTGEAFFEIAKHEELPFVIKSHRTSIKVLGTSFNVFSDMSGQVKVNVVSGVVEFSADARNSVTLSAGEQGAFHPGTDLIEKTVVNDSNFLSWKTGVLVFKETPVNKAFETLGRYYDRVLLYDNRKDRMPAITTTFDNQPLEAVLEELNLLLNTKNEFHNETIVFKPVE
jgi:transmembrane sensor